MVQRVVLGLGFRLLGFRELKDVWTVWSLHSGPRDSTGTVHERPRAHLGHTRGYMWGIVRVSFCPI